MSYTFFRRGIHTFEVRCGGKEIGTIKGEHGDLYERTSSFNQPMSDEECDAVDAAFSAYAERPEVQFGNLAEITDNPDMNKETYEILICGYLRSLVPSGKTFEAADAQADFCTKWLEGTDFFTAPASTVYHDSHIGGLVKHSLTVYNKMIELLGIASFCKVDWKAALLTALVHDWCKIGLYESYMRNVKNETTGQWEQHLAFRHKDTAIPLGHGTTSMFMAGKFFKLSTEQALAIRWHMGVYQVSDTEKPDLFRSNESYPMVYLLQFADQLSIAKY